MQDQEQLQVAAAVVAASAAAAIDEEMGRRVDAAGNQIGSVPYAVDTDRLYRLIEHETSLSSSSSCATTATSTSSTSRRSRKLQQAEHRQHASTLTPAIRVSDAATSFLSSVASDGAKTRSAPAPAAFWRELQAETSRLESYVASQREKQLWSAQALLCQLVDFQSACMSATSTSHCTQRNSAAARYNTMHHLRHQAEEQVRVCADLQRTWTENWIRLQQLAEHADREYRRHVGHCSCWGTTQSISSLLQPGSLSSGRRTVSTSSSSLVVTFSDIFSVLTSIESKQVSSDNSNNGIKLPKWVAPASFERATTKFWVPQERLDELLLRITREAPLLVVRIEASRV
jgi:hypothetical protein